MGATSCSICAGENFAVCAAAGVPSGASSAAQARRAISAASATRINGSARRLPDAPSLWGGLSSTAPRRDPPSDGMGDLYPSNRSEEHTSELQSLTNLVCRLLLEKKNK